MDFEDMQPILLLTRPERQAKRFQAECAEALGFRPQSLIAPLMEIQPRLQFLLPPDDQTLIISSENALDALFSRTDLTGREAICVGQATTKSAQGYGLAAVFGGRNATELVDNILNATDKRSFAHVRGNFTAGDIVERLRAAGHEAESYVIYDQVARPLSDGARTILKLERDVILPLFSPRSAELFFDSAPEFAARLRVIALSTAVADKVPEEVETHVAREPSASAMARHVATLFNQD